MADREDKGHFDLKLNCKTADNDKLKFRIARLILHTDNVKLSPLQYAIRNLLGVLYFYQREYCQAHKQFVWILNNGDPENLNALRNIIWVYKTIMDSKQASIYASKLETILKNAPDQRAWARCKAEHAYAHASETYGGANEQRRFLLSNELYDNCLEITADFLHSADEDFRLETAEWLICKILNFKKVFNRNYSLDRSKDKNESMYTVILETIFKIQDLVPNDSHLQSLSWGYLGYFFWKRPVAPNYDQNSAIREFPVPKLVSERNMDEYFNNPEKCFRKSIDIKEVEEVLELYTGWLCGKESYDEGIQRLNRCLELVPCNNFFSYSKRGELLVKRCKGKLENAFKDETTEIWKKDIQQAISDLEVAASVNPTSRVYCYLGSAYCLAYTGTKDEAMKLKCLCSYQKGLNCLDGKTDKLLHSQHAQCLKKLQEHDTAMCVIQRSIESQDAQTTFIGDIKNLLDWKIEKYDNNPDEQILRELAFWFHDVAFTKYNRKALKRLFEDFLKRYSNWVNLLPKFIGQLYSKDDSDFNQFTIDCLENVVKDTSHQQTLNCLTQFLKSCSVTTPAIPIKLRKNLDLRPRNTAGFEYDFYVIFSPEDKDWVYYSVISYLENYFEFKGFIEGRDDVLGQTIFTNFDDFIDKCFKFILVITPNFQKSPICNYVTEAAFSNNLRERKKSGSVIPIVKDDGVIPDYLKIIKHFDVCDQPIKHTMLESIVKALDRE